MKKGQVLNNQRFERYFMGEIELVGAVVLNTIGEYRLIVAIGNERHVVDFSLDGIMRSREVLKPCIMHKECKMKTEYIGAFQVPDGYFGDNAIVYLCFDPQKHCCLEIHATGYFRSCVPPATTREEAEWLMRNHPACKDRFKPITK